jgi:hypothetical protein
MSTPGISELLSDPCVTFRLKNWLREALGTDPVDAYYDAQLLADVLRQRVDELLGTESGNAN